MNRQRRQHCIYLRSKTIKWPPLTGPFRFLFPQNSDLPVFQIFRAVRGIRRVQIPRDICTRFERYLYSTKHSWIIISGTTYTPQRLIRDLLSNYCFILLDRAITLKMINFKTIKAITIKLGDFS